MNMILYTALITTKYGTDLMVARTQAALEHHVAKWCREYWDEEAKYHDEDDGFPLVPPEDDAEVISTYFAGNHFDFLDMDSTELLE